MTTAYYPLRLFFYAAYATEPDVDRAQISDTNMRRRGSPALDSRRMAGDRISRTPNMADLQPTV
jgi:hypothetical protein